MWQLRERQTMGIVQSIFLFLRAFIIGRATVAFENLALRQQVAAFKHSAKRPKLRRRDRIFWVLLSRFWPHWRSALDIVQPETAQGQKTQPTAKSLSRNTLAHVVSSNLDQLLTEALVDLLIGQYGAFFAAVYQKPMARETRRKRTLNLRHYSRHIEPEKRS